MLNTEESVRETEVFVNDGYIVELQNKFSLSLISFKRTAKTNGRYITNVINESLSNDVRIFKETQIKRILRNTSIPKIIKKKLSYFSQEEEDNREHVIYKLNDVQDLNVNEKYALHNIGHATQLIQISGFNILTDPVFGSLHGLLYPEKTYSFPDIKKLPKVDVILISHNHRDHVDKKSLTELLQYYEFKKWTQPNVFLPLGDKNLFRDFGFNNIVETDWFVKITVLKCFDGKKKTVHFIAIPADHRSGRSSQDCNKSLVLGWIVNPEEEDVIVKYSGDTRSLSKETQVSVDAILWNEIKGKKFNQDKTGHNVRIPDIIFLEPSGPNYTRCDMDITHQSTSYSALLKFFEAQNLSTISKTTVEHFLNKITTVILHHNKYELGPDRFNEGLFVFKKLMLYLDLNEDDLKTELTRQEDKLKNKEDKSKLINCVSLIIRPILFGLPRHTSLLVHAKDFIVRDVIEIKRLSLGKESMKECLLKRTVFPKIGERLNNDQIEQYMFDLENVQKYNKNSAVK